MGMSATETEMKAQNVKSGIGFQIVQNEKQLFLVRIKITFRAALFDVFYLALFDTLSIDGESGRLEYFDEGCELRLGHSNQRCHDAVIGYLAKFVVDHGRFLYLDLFKKQLGHQYHALASGTTLIIKATGPATPKAAIIGKKNESMASPISVFGIHPPFAPPEILYAPAPVAGSLMM